MGQKHWKIQLMDRFTGNALATAGGRALVVTAGANGRQAITTKAGASASNPVTPTRGSIEFYTDADISSVDLYVMTASGHFVVLKGVPASGCNDMWIDTQVRKQVMVIPFDMTDMVAATEFDTGFDLPQNAVVLGDGAGVLVETVDAAITIDVGILSGEAGGDADGFLVALNVAVAGFIAASGTVWGALVKIATTPVTPGQHVGDGTAESISITPLAAADTVDGKIALPYMLVDF